MTDALIAQDNAKREHDLEALARQIEAVRGMLCPILCPKGCGGRTDAERARYRLQAEAYKACSASLKAAASALRVFVAQADM